MTRILTDIAVIAGVPLVVFVCFLIVSWGIQ